MSDEPAPIDALDVAVIALALFDTIAAENSAEHREPERLIA